MSYQLIKSKLRYERRIIAIEWMAGSNHKYLKEGVYLATITRQISAQVDLQILDMIWVTHIRARTWEL